MIHTLHEGTKVIEFHWLVDRFILTMLTEIFERVWSCKQVSYSEPRGDSHLPPTPQSLMSTVDWTWLFHSTWGIMIKSVRFMTNSETKQDLSQMYMRKLSSRRGKDNCSFASIIYQESFLINNGCSSHKLLKCFQWQLKSFNNLESVGPIVSHIIRGCWEQWS